LVSAQTHCGLLFGLPLLFLICILFRRGISFLLSCSFPGSKSVTIGNDLGVTATCILLPLILLWPSKPISCPLSLMLRCYYLPIDCLSLSIQNYSHVIPSNSSYFSTHLWDSTSCVFPKLFCKNRILKAYHPSTSTHKDI
jgi:hypothetical protein